MILLLRLYYSVIQNLGDLLMLIRKIMGLSLVLIMAGCSNTQELEQRISNLTDKVDNLSSQVSDLSNDVTSLKQQQSQNTDMIESIKTVSETAANDAQQANERVDNFVESYKK